MNNKEYGVKLDIDISNFQKGLEDAKKLGQKAKQDIEAPLKSVKVQKAEIKYQMQKNNVDTANKALEYQKNIADSLNKTWEDTYYQMATINKQIKENEEAIERFAEKTRLISAIGTHNLSEEDKERWDEQIRKNTLLRNSIIDLEKQYISLGEKSKAVWDAMEKQEQAVNSATTKYENAKLKLEEYGLETEKAKDKVKELSDVQEENKKNTLKTSNNFKLFGNNISNSITKGINSLKRFSLSLLGIQSLYTMLSRAVNSYLALDDKMSVRMQANWVAIGAIFAPIVEKIIKGLQKLIAYINVFVKAFTGGKVDLLSKALKQAEKSAGKTKKSVKELNKELATMDEITNLNFDQNKGDVDESSFGVGDALKEIENMKLNPEIEAKVRQLAQFVREELIPVLQSIWQFIKEHIIPVVGQLYNAVVSCKIPWEDILVTIGLIKGGITGGLMTAVGLLIEKVIELFDAWEKQRQQQVEMGNADLKTMHLSYNRIKEINELLKDQNLTAEERKKLEDEKGTLIYEAQQAYKRMNKEAENGAEFTQEQVDEMNNMRKQIEEMTDKEWDINTELKLHPEEFKTGLQGLANWISDFSNKINPFFNEFFEIETNYKGKKFAKGNVAYQPTMAEFGEYAGARSNPEITAPQNMMRETLFEALTDALPLVNSNGGDTILYVNGRELARATYQDYQNEGTRLGNSSVAVRRVS